MRTTSTVLPPVKRLARALLLLANFGTDGRQESVIAKVSQETLADRVVQRAPRASLMNRFRQLATLITTVILNSIPPYSMLSCMRNHK